MVINNLKKINGVMGVRMSIRIGAETIEVVSQGLSEEVTWQLVEDVGQSGPNENSKHRDPEMGTYHKGQGGWSIEGQVLLR